MVKWKGLNKMKSDLKRMSKQSDKKLDDAIQDVRIMLQGEVTNAAVFTKGYSTGNLRKLITSYSTGQAKGKLVSPAHYSGYVEKGTRFMDAQPFFFNTIAGQSESIMAILKEKTR